ncbi:hypothetical protein NQ314_004444 [Rhamnusium bicolor]|uniref:Uncharacterized protein n=1 Tax=Rhamnusium bicolor TaxID=1586634 RepID=A0AAV8ZM05_9CUCU|nr:hypothetical protein NQ314_004444 [Rhamnusium bicolor]
MLELDGGPYGDSPPSDRNQELFKDFLILMFQENDEATETSESSEADKELYNLKNDYLEKLNIVRKRLNLIEISDDTEHKNQPLSYSTCTITEIVEEESSSSRSGKDCQKEKHNMEQKESCSAHSSNNGNITDPYELNTIYPASPSYNSADSASATNIFDLDYNPPKKKFCHRLRTPRFYSASEGNIPYYTKVSLREDMFKKEATPKKIPRRKHSLIKRSIHKFTKSKETQCTEEELKKI